MPLLKKARRIDQQVKDRGARLPWTYQAYSVQISLWRLPANVGFQEGQVDWRTLASACGRGGNSRADSASR